jgi:ABC-type branched-subunit amino acid transport system ATPase component
MAIHRNEFTINRPAFLGGNQWNLKRVNHINVLLGRNGSGKSLLLRKLRDGLPASCHYIVPERTGEISFTPGLMTEVVSSDGRRGRSQGNFVSNYREEIITRIQGYYTKRGTKKTSEINHDPDDLMASLEIILPDFTVKVKSENPFYELRRVKDGAVVTSVSNLSSGESQLLTLGMDILTIVGIWELDRQEERILLIDEPDAHTHPDLQIKFSDFLCHIQEKYNLQIFVATHSTTLMSALGQFGSDRVSLLYLEADKNELVAEAFNEVMKEVSSILGGHLVMGPLFSVPVMLVEGDDDYRVWIQVARSGQANISVLPCNGEEIKKYQRTLERIFSALSEDIHIRGIALLDGDKPVPTPNPDNEQKFVPFIRLNCAETENLYLTDEVLEELGYNWNSAVLKITGEADKYGNKSELLKNIGLIDRRSGDVKSIINEIAEILDPKKLLWSVRLGKIIGRTRPTGSLEEFLGDPLVHSLWTLPSKESL